MTRLLSVFLITLLPLLSEGQKKKDLAVKVVGEITDKYSGERIRGVQVTVRNNATGEESTLVSKRGKYKASLPINFEYDLIYSKVGYTTKFVRVDTREVPKAAADQGLKMFVDMVLFEDIPNFDRSVFDEPIGIAKFKYGLGLMSWDVNYSRERFTVIDRAFKMAKGEISPEDTVTQVAPHPCPELPSTVDYMLMMDSLMGIPNYYPQDKIEAAFSDSVRLSFVIGIKFLDASLLAAHGDAPSLLKTMMIIKGGLDSLSRGRIEIDQWTREVGESIGDSSALMVSVDRALEKVEKYFLSEDKPEYVRWIRFGVLIEGLRLGLRDKEVADETVKTWLETHGNWIWENFEDFADLKMRGDFTDQLVDVITKLKGVSSLSNLQETLDKFREDLLHRR